MPDVPFSLLYPDGSLAEQAREPLDLSFLSELSVQTLFTIMRSAVRFKPNQKDPIEYWTNDPEVIRYRLDIVDDLVHAEPLFDLFHKLLPELEDMKELFYVEKRKDDEIASSLSSISQIEIYTGCIDKLHAFFSKHEPMLQSSGMKALAAIVKDVYDSASFQTLKSEFSQLHFSIRNIKSVTIGVNLDVNLNPIEAGLVSLNTESYRSGNLIDKLLRVDFQNDPFTCLSPLQAVGKGTSKEQSAIFRQAVNSTLQQQFKQAVADWRPVIRLFNRVESRFLVRLVDEIGFLLGGVTLIKKLQRYGVPICKPNVEPMQSRALHIAGLYNPVYVLQLEEPAASSISPVIVNNIIFDENGMVYIFTGPNQGGKSVFTKAIGLAQTMLQLGLFVPGYRATMSPVDQILTHFPLKSDNHHFGRFGEECQRLTEQFKKLSRHSLFLLDESFSSTSAAEAAHIAEEVLQGLCEVGCKVVFATHLHDLARKIDELNASSSPESSRIDSLIAEMQSGPDEQAGRS
ncbi:MAG: mismatch repair protein MutS domain protein, partial [Paenibacillus sp.]|nr:mismatch repair protein MutS domain protein [Paenibacillus sp.]